MKTKAKTKLVHEGDFVADVPVELIETEDGWSPYLSVEDAKKSAPTVARIDTGFLTKSHSSLPRVVQQVGTRA